MFSSGMNNSDIKYYPYIYRVPYVLQCVLRICTDQNHILHINFPEQTGQFLLIAIVPKHHHEITLIHSP